jgi:hypothetical protein
MGGLDHLRTGGEIVGGGFDGHQLTGRVDEIVHAEVTVHRVSLVPLATVLP